MSSPVVLLNPTQETMQWINGPLTVEGALTATGPVEGGNLEVVEGAGTVLLDGRLARAFSLEMVGPVTLTVANWLPGIPYAITIRQNVPGGHAVTWPANFIGAEPVNEAQGSIQKQIWFKDENGKYFPCPAMII